MGAHTQEVGGGRGRWLVCALKGRDREREEREREVMWMEVRAVGERSR